MTVLALLAALLAQEIAPTPSRATSTPAKAPRSVAIYVLESRSASDRDATRRTDGTTVATHRSFDVTPTYFASASDLAVLDALELPSTPVARLLASLVEEEAHAFDPTVRCFARESMVLIDSVASEEQHARELLEAASASGRERSVAVEVRFLRLGPKSSEALKRAGLVLDAREGAARVQETKSTADEIRRLLDDDGDLLTAPRVTVAGGELFTIREVKSVGVVTAWDVVPVEELGNVLQPRITTLDEGLHVDGTALVVARSAEHGGDRIALDLEFGELAIARPIAQVNRTVDGKEVVVQQPIVKQSSLHALFTLAPEQRVLLAGLSRPTFKEGEAGRPVLLEVVAHAVAATDSELKRKEH
jgi:hypothetical protein